MSFLSIPHHILTIIVHSLARASLRPCRIWFVWFGPRFVRSIIVHFCFEVQQKVRIEVYHVSNPKSKALNSQEFLGGARSSVVIEIMRGGIPRNVHGRTVFHRGQFIRLIMSILRSLMCPINVTDVRNCETRCTHCIMIASIDISKSPTRPWISTFGSERCVSHRGSDFLNIQYRCHW